MRTIITNHNSSLKLYRFPLFPRFVQDKFNLKNLCEHAASKLFDEIDILSEKMSCFDNILVTKIT